MADKLERLLTLTATLLHAERPLTAEELRERVPGYPDSEAGFRRSFARDKEDLREMGVPLELVPRPFADPPIDGYVIRRSDYYLPDPGLAPDELAALHLATSVVRLDGVGGLGAFWKLGGLPRSHSEPVPELQVSLPTTEHLVAVYQAFVERRSLRFTYRDKARHVDPYRLDSLRGRWYLTGFDHDRGEERNFRVDRIEGGVKLGRAGAFDRPATAVPGQVMQPWQLGEGEPVRARVVVDAVAAAPAMTAVDPTSVVARQPDGSVILELDVTNRDAFRSFVFTFLEHAEVLEPPELRKDLVAWLEGVARA